VQVWLASQRPGIAGVESQLQQRDVSQENHQQLLSCCCACLQVWLASQRPGIAGVVLHSPMLSGVRVFNPNLKYWCVLLQMLCL
jgi:hypothetical protein